MVDLRKSGTMLASLVAVVTFALVVAACGGSKPNVAASPTTIAASNPGAPGVSATTEATPTTLAPTTLAPTTTEPNTAVIHACSTSMLSASVSGDNGAAGTIYSNLIFKNIGSTTCTLFGYPGVSLVDCCGHQIGAAVPRDPSTYGEGTVTLTSGETVGAVFSYHDAYVNTVANCQPTNATGLRIYPPNQTAALFVPDALLVCANAATNGTAAIEPVTALSNLPG